MPEIIGRRPTESGGPQPYRSFHLDCNQLSFSIMAPRPLPKMTFFLAAALQRGRSFLSPAASSESLSTLSNPPRTSVKATDGNLFPKVDPATDGEDCDHNCQSCTIKYPQKWKIEENDMLYGHVHGWATHILVATGKTDWVRDVQDEKGSVMEAIGKYGKEPSNGVRWPPKKLPSLLDR